MPIKLCKCRVEFCLCACFPCASPASGQRQTKTAATFLSKKNSCLALQKIPAPRQKKAARPWAAPNCVLPRNGGLKITSPVCTHLDKETLTHKPPSPPARPCSSKSSTPPTSASTSHLAICPVIWSERWCQVGPSLALP